MHFCHWAIAIGLAGLAHLPAWAVYKCVDANGRVTFQQSACSGATQGAKLDVQPASGYPASPPPSNAATADSSSPRASEADRLNALSARLAKENRLSTLNNLTIGGAQDDIVRARRQCQAELDAVRNRKKLASNDLAGATWEQSLSAEMQAIAAQCDTEQRRLQAILDRYLTEKQDLERELAKP
ncbi:DUF4124 domain-containing protein [Comamonas antarctica]|uniref:DUF4124 domain-containing protein n=1 Tax=Comamonas antarctica TaxID=2743470 RepID=UPI0028EC2AAD|nr:DUF4124 domain-containing protein [Comamonas antarctica]